ncbi:MAG: hypothetical protein KAT05_04400 [Spirochaetes bacterium]|nr:hypothetical protein [Spirochaetota bacterium]
MNKYLTIFSFWLSLIFIIFINCSQRLAEDTYKNSHSSNAIVSDSAASNAKKLIFLLSLKIADQSIYDGEHIVIPMIENVTIKLNNQLWGVFDSVNSDITDMTEDVYNDFPLRSTKYEYLVIAGYPSFDKTSDITAGDYADYLNGALELGDYICEISELTIRSLEDKTITIKPHILHYFEVNANQESIYLESHEVAIESLN